LLCGVKPVSSGCKERHFERRNECSNSDRSNEVESIDNTNRVKKMSEKEESVEKNSTVEENLSADCERMEEDPSPLPKDLSMSVAQVSSQRISESEREQNEEVDPDCPEVMMAAAAASGGIVVPIEFCGEVTWALVDTGAACSMVCHQWALKHSVTIDTVNPPLLRGFGAESRVKAIGSFTAKLKLHGIQMNPCRFIVVSESPAAALPVILGEDFLINNSVGVDIQSKSVVCPTKGGSVVIRVGNSSSECRVMYRDVRCVSAQAVSLKVGETTSVETVWNLGKVAPCCFCPLKRRSFF